MRRSRRHVRMPPDLTSLFDVLFIVIFAALIRAAAVEKAAAQPAPQPPAPAPVPPVKLATADLQAKALADLGQQLAARPYIVVRVAGAAGTITALEHDNQLTPLSTPLLEHSPDPDIGLAYLGDRAAELRICHVVAAHLGVPDLARYLVIIAPDVHLADLSHALYEGLRRDIDRCLADEQALAVLVDPSVKGSP